MRAHPELLAPLERTLVVVASDPSPGGVLELQERHRPSMDYEFGPETVGDGTLPRMAGSLGMVVRLGPQPGWPAPALSAVTDYFLHSPTLRVPIEPLSQISMAMADGKGVTLWRLYHETLGTHWYVDASNRVSLSERWARRGLFFGRVGDSLETLRGSDLWRRLEGYRPAVFANLSPCATCTHFPWCAGFWLAPEDVADVHACAPWRAAMDRLLEAYRSVQETAVAEAR